MEEIHRCCLCALGRKQELNEFQTLLNESSEYLKFTVHCYFYCYVGILCTPFPSGMVYHIASYAGLNESVANSQILTAMPRK
jgi:hypothetical protein